MATPTINNITVNTWVLVATSTTLCNVARKKPGFEYYYTTRDTGGAAPAAISGTTVPAEAVKLFAGCNPENDLILNYADSDVYICCFVKDSNIGTGAGQVRIGA